MTLRFDLFIDLLLCTIVWVLIEKLCSGECFFLHDVEKLEHNFLIVVTSIKKEFNALHYDFSFHFFSCERKVHIFCVENTKVGFVAKWILKNVVNN